MCLNKDRYASDMQAAAAVGRVLARYGKEMRPYRCPSCGGWHLTSQVKKNLTAVTMADIFPQ